ISVIESRLQTAHGCCPNNASWLANVDTLQASCAAEECICGNPDSGTNHSALILALCRYAIKCRCGAEIDHDAGTAVFLECRYAIHNAISANFRRVLIEHRHAGFDSRLDEQRLLMEVALADASQGGIQRRNHGRDYDPMNLFRFEPLHRKEVAEEHAIFVYGLGAKGRDPPVRDQLVVTSAGRFRENSQDCVGIADIEDQEHSS